MAAGNIDILVGGNVSTSPTRKFQVAAGAVGSILFGEPVVQTAAGSPYVIPAPNGSPVIGTDVLTGVAQRTSTDTVGLDGIVDVVVTLPGMTYICDALVPANIATQALYDALVGNRVLFDLTAGVYTVDESTADNAANDLLIVDLDVSKYPNKVAFQFKMSGTILN